MKRFLFLISIALVLAQGCSYQIPDYIQEAQKEFNQVAGSRYDNDTIIELDPIEQIPTFPTRSMQNNGNWGYDALEVGKWAEYIARNAKRKVHVDVFDTSADFDDENLKGVIIPGRVYTGENPIGTNGHSWHVTSTIGGLTENGRHIGIAEPLRLAEHLEIQPHKVLSNSGSGGASGITQAARDALEDARGLIDDGYFVIWNYSLGGSRPWSSLEQVFDEASELGVLVVVAAAGNSGREGVSFPGSDENAQAVAAVDKNRKRAWFSTYGDEVAISGPGVGIYGILPNGQRGVLNGTSMATPHVTAVCAILASVYPQSTASEIIEHIQRYSRDLGDKGKDKYFGHGLPVLTPLLENPIDGQPDDPGEPAPPDDPEQPDEPGRTTEDVYSFGDNKFLIYWNTRQRITEGKGYRKLWFTPTVRMEATGATVADRAATVYEFTHAQLRNRGYVLPDGSDEYDAVFWAGFFYQLIAGKEDVDAEFTKAIFYLDNNVEMTLEDFENRPTSRKATKCNALTFDFSW